MKRLFFGIAIFIAYSISAQVPSNGLVGYWSFNGTINDNSGNGYDFTLNGASFATDRFGNSNYALYFNGFSEVYNTNPKLQEVFDNHNSFSINFWFNTLGSEDMNVFTCDGENDSPYKRTGVSVCQNSKLPNVSICRYNSDMGAGNCGLIYGLPENSLIRDKWYHLSFNYDGNDAYVYLDGEKLTPTLDASWFTGFEGHNKSMESGFTKGVVLGGNFQNNVLLFSGKLDDVRIYNRTLNSVEVNALTNEGKCFQTIYDTVNIKVYDIDTIIVYDTIPIYTQVFDTIPVFNLISITDTLIINVAFATKPQSYDVNTFNVYPNPAKDHLVINTGDYLNMVDYSIKIVNQLGSTVFETMIMQPIYEIDLSSWSGTGMYIMRIYNNEEVISNKKIVLQ
jgi:hypothetical protein